MRNSDDEEIRLATAAIILWVLVATLIALLVPQHDVTAAVLRLVGGTLAAMVIFLCYAGVRGSSSKEGSQKWHR